MSGDEKIVINSKKDDLIKKHQENLTELDKRHNDFELDDQAYKIIRSELEVNHSCDIMYLLGHKILNENRNKIIKNYQTQLARLKKIYDNCELMQDEYEKQRSLLDAKFKSDMARFRGADRI